MKKLISILLVLTLSLAILAGCAKTASTSDSTTATDASTSDSELTVIKVGASSTPHAEILEQVKSVLAAQGYDLQIVVY